MSETCGICQKKFSKKYVRTIRSSFILAMSGEEIESCIDEQNNKLVIPLKENCFVHKSCDNQELKRIETGEINLGALWPASTAI